jgi:hypothetical protein
MTEENILRIESECEIIRPVFIKRKFNNLFDSEENHSSKISQNKNSMRKEEEIRDEKEEDKGNQVDNSQKNSIMEILNILNQPINHLYSNNRYILEKDISEIYDLKEDEENDDNNSDDEIENELKSKNLLNVRKDNELGNINFFKQQIWDKNNSLKNEVRI